MAVFQRSVITDAVEVEFELEAGDERQPVSPESVERRAQICLVE
jgi:hypothetical protein